MNVEFINDIEFRIVTEIYLKIILIKYSWKIDSKKFMVRINAISSE